MKDYVIVTGGVGGIGGAITERFIEGGYRVVAIDTDAAHGAEFQKRLGGDFVYANADVTDPAALIALREKLGKLPLRHIVTLAGRALAEEWKGFAAADVSVIGESLALNLAGHLNTLHVFYPLLAETEGDKSATLISSINAEGGYGLPVYSAAKAGLLGFVNAACAEFGEQGVRINAVSPGTVPTAATQTEPKDFEALKKTTSLGRFASQGDVAELVFFIAHCAHTVTGQNFVIDAGQLRKR